jgi:hypothetical protein
MLHAAIIRGKFRKASVSETRRGALRQESISCVHIGSNTCVRVAIHLRPPICPVNYDAGRVETLNKPDLCSQTDFNVTPLLRPAGIGCRANLIAAFNLSMYSAIHRTHSDPLLATSTPSSQLLEPERLSAARYVYKANQAYPDLYRPAICALPVSIYGKPDFISPEF